MGKIKHVFRIEIKFNVLRHAYKMHLTTYSVM
jgi:hypothetical protein